MYRYFSILVVLFITALMNAQTINGPSYLCSGSSGSYSLSTTWGAGYYWRHSSNLSLSSTTTNNITVTASGSGSTAWLEVIDPNSMGYVAQKAFSIGGPVIDINGPTSVSVGVDNYYYITVSSSYTGPTSILQYEWVFNSPYGNLYEYGSWASLYIWTAGSYRIEARARNSCGWGPWAFIYMDASRGAAVSPYRVYPNPVNDILFIEIDPQQSLSNANRQQLTYDIRLYDTQGNLALNQNAQSGTIQIDVSNLRNGMYMMQIFDGADPQPYATIVIKQ